MFAEMQKTKLIIIGGFLGAGKTTLLAATSSMLTARGHRVGLITNDQAQGLVDTHTLSNSGVGVQEVAGSCFCCDFDTMMESAQYLREALQCDVIVAEPVGSCTDLSATLMQPIKEFYSDQFELLPLSVLVDPHRLIDSMKSSEAVCQGSGYIYSKQIEEADFLLIGKSDTLEDQTQTELQEYLHQRYADYPIHWLSPKLRKGIGSWMDAILSGVTTPGGRIVEVDYDVYAAGEALMGWYNATFVVEHEGGLLVPWEHFTYEVLDVLSRVLEHEKISIGHIKTFLKSGSSGIRGNLIGTGQPITVQGEPFSSRSARYVLNIRAEANPDLLREVVDDLIKEYQTHAILFHKEEVNHLSPGRPQPTHRYSEVYR